MAPASVLQAGDAATWINREGQPNALTDAAFDAFYLPASLHPFVNPGASFVNPPRAFRLAPGNECVAGDDVPQTLLSGLCYSDPRGHTNALRSKAIAADP
jgi:hypothetical protein